MIGYLEGRVIKSGEEGILLVAGNVGYEIILPSVVFEKVKTMDSEKPVSLYIYFHQTERQPKPVLIGFNTEKEKEFFQLFISVSAIGPLKAVKAMEKPVSEIAQAIESKDVAFLSTLKGIGKRTAQKIIASLHGKAGDFVLATDSGHDKGLDNGLGNMSVSMREVTDQVKDVLVEQLGYTGAMAGRMIAEALERNHLITTPEELFDEVYHGI